jgi:hypothetical protein
MTQSDFEQFWARYPRRIGKLAAEKAYTKARKTASAQQILDGLARYQFAADPQYVPHPRTWLCQGRYLDEPEPARAAPAAEEDWFEQCQRLHQGACGLSQYRHRLRMQMDAQREQEG